MQKHRHSKPRGRVLTASGMQNLNVLVDPGIYKRLKLAAIARETTAKVAVNEALTAWLEKTEKTGKTDKTDKKGS